MDVRIGDIVKLKKPHPCGGSEFRVLRVGMDFKLKCLSCGRELLLPRLKCEKSIRKLVRPEAPEGQGAGAAPTGAASGGH